MTAPTYSTERLQEAAQNAMTANAELVSRYPQTQEDHEHSKSFKTRFEQALGETLTRETELLGVIDAGLAKYGLRGENPTFVAPSKFLEFIETHADLLMPGVGRHPGYSPFKITADYSVLLNEADPGEEPHYVIPTRDAVLLCTFLVQRGIDITQLDRETLQALLQSQVLPSFSALVTEMYRGSQKTTEIIAEERDSYASNLKQEVSHLINEARTGRLDTQRLKEIFELYQYIPSRSSDEIHSMYPEFKALIEAKKEMSPENTQKLNEFLEGNEKLIFAGLRGKEFAKLADELGDFEEGYRRFFGYTPAEIWARRERNWTEVNDYIVNVIRARGYLTVDDLRQMQTLSSKGVLPYFCHGLRSDRSLEMPEIELAKREVTIGGNVATFPVDKLEEGLELLVGKANRVVNAHFPKIVAEVAWANLMAEYASMHPHPDGNGTNAVLFIEALKALEGNYTPPERYDHNFRARVLNALNGNRLAISITALKVLAYEYTHPKK